MQKIYNKLQNPNEFLDFFKNNIAYGWINENGRKAINNEKIFEEYKLQTLKQFLKSGLGICIEQVELERNFFSKKGISICNF